MNPTWMYVLAVYAIAVWLARRGGVDLPWRIAALFYLLALLFLYRPMTQPCVNVPVDYVQMLPPWAQATNSHTVTNGEINDVPLQMVPWAHEVRESWKALQVPLWNARAGSGYPLLANGQSGALSPLRLIALPLPLGYSFTAEAALKFLIAMTFTYLLCRRRRYSDLASAIGAASFGFSSFIVVWLHFPHATVAAFLPAVIYAVELWAERRTYRRFVFAAVVWVPLLFGGHPETAAHIFALAFLLMLWIVAVERPFASARDAWLFVLTLGGALVVAALLASPFLAPLAEALPKSQRFQQVKVSAPEVSPFKDFASQVILLEPHFYGDPPIERPWGPESAESMTGFAGILGAVGWIAILLDAVAERRFRRRDLFLVVATLLVLGVILDWPVAGTVFNSALSMAANARVRLLLCLLMALQGAAAIDLIERGKAQQVLLALFVVSLVFLALMTLTDFAADWQRGSALLALLPSMAVIATAALATLAPRVRGSLLMLVAVLVVTELWSVGISWNPIVPERLMYPRTPLITQLEKLRDAAPPASFRIVGIGPVLFPNTSAIYGLDDIRAHDPMANGRYLGMLRLIAGYTVENYFAMWNDVETRILDYLNVRYVVTPPKTEMHDQQRYRMVYDGKDGRIFENRDVLPRFYPAPAVVLEFKGERFVKRLTQHSDWAREAILKKLDVENDRERTDLLAPRPPGSPRTRLRMKSASETDYRMHVDAPRYSLIVSSIPWWPGWRVERNGERSDVIQVNGTFVGFVVRPGTTNVRVYFSSRTFNFAALMSLLTLAVLAALSIESLRRRVPGLRQSE